MFYFKACPKCQGDQTLEKDAYGEFKKCLQCGTLIEVEVAQFALADSADQPKATRKARTVVAA